MNTFDKICMTLLVSLGIAIVIAVPIAVHQSAIERKRCEAQNGVYLTGRGFEACVKKDSILDTHEELK